MSVTMTRKRTWEHAGWAFLLTVAAMGAIELLSHTIIRPPTLTMLLAIVAYVAFRWGRRASLLSAGLVSLYGAYYYASPTHILENPAEDALRLGALLGTSFVVALLVGDLRNAVRASEKRLRRELAFRNAIDSSLGEGVYALDTEGRLTFMNPAAERLLGWSEAEICGRIMHDLVHFQHADGSPFPREECAALNSVLHSGTVYRTDDDVFTHKDGQIFPIAYSAAPIHVDGQVHGVVVVFHDLTERKRAERALRESEAKLRLITSQLPAYVWTTDRSLRVTSLLGTELLHGNLDPNRYIGRSLEALLGLANRDVTQVLEVHRRALHGEPAGYLLPSRGRELEARVEPLRDAQGQIIGCLGLARDVTERLQAEERLRTQEQWFRSLVQNAPGIITVILADGTIRYQSPSIERVLGYTAAQLVGKRVFDVLPIHPEDRARAKAVMADILRQPGANVTAEIRLGHADGSWRYVESISTNLLGDPAIAGIVSNYRDITERKRAEAALLARARQQAAVAELGRQALEMHDPAMLMDRATALVAGTLGAEYARIMELLPSGEALLMRAGTGWQAGQVGRTTVEADYRTFAGYTLLSRGPVVATDLACETRFRPSALQREHQVVSSASVTVHGRNGPFGVLSVDTTHHRVFSDDDVYFLEAIAHVIAAALERSTFERELVHQRDATERLTELDRLRTEFIGSVSHDLRTPLTAALAGLGLFEASTAERLAPAQRQLLANVRRNVERLRLLIDDLLALNQVEAGAVQLECEPLDLRAVVSDAVTELQALMRDKEQTLELDLSEPLPIIGDARRLMRVVANLLANAHQHTPPHTQIVVAGWLADGQVRLAVRDSGPGIPPEELEAIFQRFHRLGSPNSGSGLGLAIARGIVELHGGRIWAESEFGKGATFQIALPRIAAGAS
jgi:PAS domain S-box-containing protein